ncbi:13603_t:CDS:2 [Acaulospora colombiana]|uniref:13603_t:CDS:1 n=1 Tax=Acaulospora colombiana TaxID=27376 RepID=A0ACA9P4T2_9GLOM|nr:13603_t:CDS:2 [Acaulospora colombiana]
MSGLEATRELRRLESLGQIPPQRIIALTGNARKEQLENAINAGMDEVMTKPYRLPELLERIRARRA